MMHVNLFADEKEDFAVMDEMLKDAHAFYVTANTAAFYRAALNTASLSKISTNVS